MLSAEMRSERRGGAAPSVNAAAPTGMGALREPYMYDMIVKACARCHEQGIKYYCVYP